MIRLPLQRITYKELFFDFLLVRCPKGTYYDLLHEKCIKCSPGSYQSEEGRFECFKCPEGTSTVGEDSKNFTACRGTKVIRKIQSAQLYASTS